MLNSTTGWAPTRYSGPGSGQNHPQILRRSLNFYAASGEIGSALYERLRRLVVARPRSARGGLFLCTPGGDPDYAYRIARMMRSFHDEFLLYVAGGCKSAGTLVALGAHQIVFEEQGELGPLDVQVFSPDEFIRRSSGLSVIQALEFVNRQTFETFEEVFLNIRSRSGGIITTKTAGEIATKIATGLYSPITDKIDPSRIGELQRSIDIALHYGVRLGADQRLVQHLITGYPSHTFVIDCEEAEQIFPSVRMMDPFETLVLTNANDRLLDGHRPLTRYTDHILAAYIAIDVVRSSKERRNESKGSKKGVRPSKKKAGPVRTSKSKGNKD